MDLKVVDVQDIKWSDFDFIVLCMFKYMEAESNLKNDPDDDANKVCEVMDFPSLFFSEKSDTIFIDKTVLRYRLRYG